MDSDNVLNKTADIASESDKGIKCPTLGEVMSKKKAEAEAENVLSPLFVKAHKRLLGLYSLIDDGTDAVAKLREAAIQKEVEKQKAEELKWFSLESYLARMEKEALESYNKLDEKWNEIAKLQDPLDLKTETAVHRETCNTLLEEKNKEIQFLKDTLKKKDELFLKEVEDQGSEIDILFNRIEEQILKAKEAYTKELEALEEIIDEEKKAMIKTNREKWETLLQEKDNVDKEFIKKICNLIESHKQPMLLAEKEHLDYKRIMRSKLDRYVHDLTVQSEFLKSICILNTEKLTYNKQLLLNKQQDNNMIKEHCRKYNTRMGNKLASEKKKLKEKKFQIISKMKLYSSKVVKLSSQIISIDKRCDNLALSNSKKYFDLWNFIEKEVEELFQEICICEKIIHEECLFIPWESPNYQRMNPQSYLAAMELFTALQKKKKSKSSKQLSKIQIPKWQDVAQIVLNGIKYSLVKRNKESEIPYLSTKNQRLISLNNILEILGLKTDDQMMLLTKYFLPYIVCPECDINSTDRKSQSSLKIDGSCVSNTFYNSQAEEPVTDSRESLESFLASDQAQPLIIEIFESTTDIVAKETEFLKKDENYAWKVDLFTKTYFGDYQYPESPIEQVLEDIQGTDYCVPPLKQITEVENGDMSLRVCTDKTHSPYINPLDITRAVENFTLHMSEAEEKDVSLNVQEILNKDRTSPASMMDSKEVTDYWESLIMAFNDKKIELWETMLHTIQDYLTALQKRHNLNAELKKLRITNKELRRLLRKYDMDAKDEIPV